MGTQQTQFYFEFFIYAPFLKNINSTLQGKQNTNLTYKLYSALPQSY